MTATNTPGLLIVIDPGTSLIKAVYTGRSGKPEPLALPPELVRSVTPAQAEAQIAEYGDDPLRSAFVEFNGTIYAAGEFAMDLAGRQYHELSKWNDLTPRLLTILGLVCTEVGVTQGSATIGPLLPRDELNPPSVTQSWQRFSKPRETLSFGMFQLAVAPFSNCCGGIGVICSPCCLSAIPRAKPCPFGYPCGDGRRAQHLTANLPGW